VKIAINAVDFRAGCMGGVESYLRNLWRHLHQMDGENSYALYCAERYFSAFPSTKTDFGHQSIDCSHGSLNWFVRGALRHAVGYDVLKLLLRKVDADVIHHPFSVLKPCGLAIPSVLTFWDMQHEFYPEFFSKKILKLRKQNYANSAQQATRIIVSAEFTKKCLIEKYDIDALKIDVVYTGYGSEYKVLEDIESLEMVRNKYCLDVPFLLYPAATWPHKNHNLLLHAIKLLRDKYRFDGQLVLTGVAMQSQREILSLIEELGLSQQVKVLGYLPYEELPFLYNLAQLMVFPSLFEGFGIPLVEAMACGCPVVCSNVTSIPEVVGSSGVMFDPHSVEEMVEAIWSVWCDEEMQQQMRQSGLQRVAMFDWSDTARKTMDVYKKALS